MAERSAEPAAQQLALRLPLDEDATFANFIPVGAAQAAAAALQSDALEHLYFLHGPTETGKSHLLQASCQDMSGGAIYLPLQELVDLDAAGLLQNLEQAPLVALDGTDAVAGIAQWEEALFHLVNRCRASGTVLLFAARMPPLELPLRLADLRSRLAGGLLWAMPPYSETERREILRFRAQRRGLILSDPVLDYLATRARRSLLEQLDVLEQLDEASLRAKRAITVPFVREVLGS